LVEHSAEFAIAMDSVAQRHPDADPRSIELVSYSKSRRYKDEKLDLMVLKLSIEGSIFEEVIFERTNSNWVLVEETKTR